MPSGSFWQPSIEWRKVPADAFTMFDEPGWGKIALNFAVMPYGDRSTPLTCEFRTVTTDAASRTKFLRCRRFGRPVIAHIFHATVRTIGDDAEHREVSSRTS